MKSIVRGTLSLGLVLLPAMARAEQVFDLGDIARVAVSGFIEEEYTRTA